MEKKNQKPRLNVRSLTSHFSMAVLIGFTLLLPAQFNPALAANPLIGQETAIIAKTNAIRSEAGLPALSQNAKLMRSAAAKAADMAAQGYFDHASPDGYRMAHWINAQGYTFTLAGENLAKGFSSLDRLMNAWVASPTHYKNLVESRFSDIGVGMAEGTYEGQSIVFVVQHFGTPVTPANQSATQLTADAASLVGPLIEAVAGSTEDKTGVNQPLVSSTSYRVSLAPETPHATTTSPFSITAAKAANDIIAIPNQANPFPAQLMVALMALAGLIAWGDLWLMVKSSLEIKRALK